MAFHPEIADDTHGEVPLAKGGHHGGYEVERLQLGEEVHLVARGDCRLPKK
jgi:hypothetical protein